MVKQDDIRELIINVARNIFAKFGFRKTTMEEIAQAARKGKSSIYHYFNSKEEIFNAVVEKETSALHLALTEAVRMASNPEDKLKAYIRTRMDTIGNLANLYSALRDEYLDHFSFIERIRSQFDHKEIKMIKEILVEGTNKGDFNVEDHEMAAFGIITALKGLEYPIFIKKEFVDFEVKFSGLIDILFNGILKK
jgi:AcrR family transcriptional regulator